MHHLTVIGLDVTLDGRPISVPPGANPHTVAVRAAKELAAAEAQPGQSVQFEVRNEQGVLPLEITDGNVRAGDLRRPSGGGGTEEANAAGESHAAPSTPAAPGQDMPHWPQSPSQSQGPGATVPVDQGQTPNRSENAPTSPAESAGERPRYDGQPAPDVVSSLRSAWATSTDARPGTAPSFPGGGGMPQSHAGSAPPPAPPEPRPFDHTFIETHRTEAPPQPNAVGGFAGVLAQFGIGGPSQAQQSEEADKIAVSKVWTRPKGIAVANGKGGSGKTPTSLYIAAMFARLGGGMVLVDDNNTFRGAAGWQTENAAHGATKEDLLTALPSFDGSERAADMARFTHHQTVDRYDVLQSRPQKLARDQALDDDEFDAIQQLLRRFYRVVVFDSGNDESAPNWLRMIHHSDVLVVPTATSPKHCESAKLLLEALTASGGHGAELARNAVIVVSHASTNDPAPEQIAPRFAGMARHVLTIPHDPAIAREWLRWDDLAPKTQRAWLAVGAAIARGLED